MAALTANKEREYEISPKEFIRPFEVFENTHIYNGALVMVNSDGYLIPAADTATCIFIGIAIEEGDNSSGSSGDKTVNVKIDARVWLSWSGADVDRLGKGVYPVDDDNVAGAPGTNISCIGRVVGYKTSPAEVLVQLNNQVQSAGQV